MIPKTTQDQVTQTLVAQQIPEAKARSMTKSIGRGIALILLGLVLLVAGVGLVIYIIVKLAKEPALSVMLLSGFLGLAGVYFLVAGGNVISGQALDAAGESPLFGLAAKAIRLWKPKVP